MAYPVEPFGLRLVPVNPLSPISENCRNSFWEHTAVFGQLHDRQANMFQNAHESSVNIHSMVPSLVDFNSPPNARFSGKCEPAKVASAVFSSQHIRDSLRGGGIVLPLLVCDEPVFMMTGVLNAADLHPFAV